MKKLYIPVIFILFSAVYSFGQVPTRLLQADEITERGLFDTPPIQSVKDMEKIDLTSILEDDKKEKMQVLAHIDSE